MSQPNDGTGAPAGGGPLGCVLGLLGGFLGTTLLLPWSGWALALVVLVVLAVLGWQIGRRVFRTFESVRHGDE